MPNQFLEQRLPFVVEGGVRYGASWSDGYDVTITRTASGQEHRSLVHPLPLRRFTVSYIKDKSDMWDDILALYHRAYGKFAGFRVKAIDDYTTNNNTLTPTAFDQELTIVSSGVYQLVKQYGGGDTALSIGLPTRTIYKPVTGTVKLGFTNTTYHYDLETDTVAPTGYYTITSFTVDTTTGKITLAANKSKSITGITNAVSAVITVGAHTFIVGESVYISGVIDSMTAINDLRGTITAKDANTITVDIDTRYFSSYMSGGTVQTWPGSEETVYGGCEFDLPCRFDSEITLTPRTPSFDETGYIDIMELLVP